jgi:GxxExxY protein
MESELEELARRVIGAAIEVHRQLGPGFAESIYELALESEFELRSIPFQRQAEFAIHYKGRQVGEGRLDFLVGGCLIVELKVAERFTEVHLAQVLSYLKATGHRLALLINFDVHQLTGGIKRVIR